MQSTLRACLIGISLSPCALEVLSLSLALLLFLTINFTILCLVFQFHIFKSDADNGTARKTISVTSSGHITWRFSHLSSCCLYIFSPFSPFTSSLFTIYQWLHLFSFFLSCRSLSLSLPPLFLRISWHSLGNWGARAIHIHCSILPTDHSRERCPPFSGACRHLDVGVSWQSYSDSA